MADVTCVVPVLLQYRTANGAVRTDKGGRAALWRQGERRFLLTVQQLATYADLGPDDTLEAVVRPQLRPARDGSRVLAYANVASVAIPTWTRVEYPDDASEEESVLQLDDDVRLDLRIHDHVYYLDVTDRAWAESPQMQPLEESSMQVSLGELVRFGRQRRLGTGFLDELPQWRPVQELDGRAKESRYPGAANSFYSVGCSAQVPPVGAQGCKGGQIAFAFPSQVLNDYCYRPPMFLIDVNVKGSSVGWPVLNEDGELVGLLSAPYYPTESKDLCWPGTWVCAIPAGLTLPEPEAPAPADAAAKPAKKKAANKKKKAKGKKRK